MESFISLYKTEAIATNVFHVGPVKTLLDVEYATACWVDWWNHRRLHSSTGQIPPAEHEQNYYAALNREAHPVEERQRTRDGSQSHRARTFSPVGVSDEVLVDAV
ncbi:MAG: family transposase [Nocardioides sp.]|jgi:hypothetical protein|nr:family transposase [Nocardioides sp.]